MVSACDCRSLKRERDQLQQRLDTPQQANLAQQALPTDAEQMQLADVQAELAAAQEQSQVSLITLQAYLSPITLSRSDTSNVGRVHALVDKLSALSAPTIAHEQRSLSVEDW